MIKEVSYGKRKKNISVEHVKGWKKYFGLMFRSSETQPLYFSFSSGKKIVIHSWFVFFSFLAVWLDSKDSVIRWEIVKPFTASLYGPQGCAALLEIPCISEKAAFNNFIVGKRKI